MHVFIFWVFTGGIYLSLGSGPEHYQETNEVHNA